jgi:hypothetical protein
LCCLRSCCRAGTNIACMATIYDYECRKCGNKYNSGDLLGNQLRCADCDVDLYPYRAPNPVRATSTSTSRASVTRTLGSESVQAETLLLERLVEAQNRTTHAVRSLARFFFISLSTSLFGYSLMSAGAAPISCAVRQSDCGIPGLVIFGWLVALVGFGVAMFVGISELNKS